jgi:hypothetical protein
MKAYAVRNGVMYGNTGEDPDQVVYLQGLAIFTDLDEARGYCLQLLPMMGKWITDDRWAVMFREVWEVEASRGSELLQGASLTQVGGEHLGTIYVSRPDKVPHIYSQGG